MTPPPRSKSSRRAWPSDRTTRRRSIVLIRVTPGLPAADAARPAINLGIVLDRIRFDGRVEP